MAFGTAGLRAAMGVGFALIKDMTIIQSKQPYAVKRLGVAADVMVTASHNPKEDNGCKELSLRLAKRESAKIVMATDPDADGLGFAEQKIPIQSDTQKHPGSMPCSMTDLPSGQKT
ncbi:glucose 1,6-bisphosphate synthase-like [Oncorhynchus nerka]|uniref:glucose 1,6-bisphosphate synthase-like n=1 Tax=Oncorhynchus nerka TaxID=8023 RepID=UPI0031B88A9E